LTEDRPVAEKRRRRRGVLFWTLLALGMIAALLLTFALLGRYGVLSPAGRDVVSTFVNGKKLGRYGRINVYGLRGDLWSDFTLERVTVTDAKGVWLDARNVRVDWTYASLLRRRFHADLIDAQKVTLIRRPEVEPSVEPPKPLPLTIDIDRFEADVELLAGFSKEYGRWTLTGETELDRAGRKQAKVRAASLNRKGDYLLADVDLGGPKGMKINAEAFEAAGGALAGAFGFSPDRPFSAVIRTDGEMTDAKFHAVVKTGDFVPLIASGAWNKEGLQATGRMAFGASDLLTPFAERLGAEARFGVAARRSTTGRYGLGWNVEADNLSSRARGLIDPKTRATVGGVRIDVSTPSLSRLVQKQVAGPARFQGEWRGDPANWTVSGDTSFAQVVAGDAYRLGRASGPVKVTFAKGRYDVDAALKGTGGTGSGVIPGLLGARPEAEVQLTRMADGRLLLERFEATGSGLRMSGKGGRTVTGGLGFQGRATLTNLSLIRRGAGGELNGTWRASQTRAGRPWSFGFDARGRRFATGMGQLDRLLGASPRLQADGSLDAGRLAVSKASLTGKAGRLNGRGLIGLGGGDLRLKLDWAAKGPFAAGPVEIAGDARGSGSLTGSITRPRLDLRAFFDELDLGPLVLTKSDLFLTFRKNRNVSDGRIVLTGGSAYGPAKAVSNFRFAPDGVRLSDLLVNAGGVQAQGSVALRRGAPSSADLTFAAGPGAFLQSGTASGYVRITDGPANAGAAVDVTGQNVRLRGSGMLFRRIRLNGQGTLGRLPFTVDADVAGANPIRFAGNGVYSRVGRAQSVALNGQGSVRGVAFSTNQPLVVALSPQGRKLNADLTVGGGRLTADASQAGQTLTARAALDGVSLRALHEDLDGRIDATVALNGRGGRLDGTADARLDDARARGTGPQMAVDGTVRAVLADDRLRLTASALDQGGVRANADVLLPVIASAAPLRLAVERTRPMSGSFDLQGEVAPVWNLFYGGERSLAGRLNARGTLAGSLNAPQVEGFAAMQGGRFEDFGTGLTLRDLNTEVEFDSGSAVVRSFSATDGEGGAINGEGRMNLRAGGSSTFTLNLRQFQAIDNNIATAKVSGPVTLTRATDGKLAVVGRLRVDRADIAPNPIGRSGVVQMNVVEINKPGADEADLQPPRAPGPGVALDVTLDAPRSIYVEGRGLDVEMALDAHVGGTTNRPILTGEARVVRGDFQFAGKRFVFDQRGTVTLSSNPRDIRLDLRAVREDPTLTAIIRVRGTAAEPEITFGSEPALPQDEILAQVLFGRSASQLSGLEAAQLAASVASLAGGGGGFDVFANLREFAGLDRLTFGGGQSGMTVAGGKYISDDVYLELIGGGQEGPAVQVEWRARRNVSVISRITGQGGAKLAVRWRREKR